MFKDQKNEAKDTLKHLEPPFDYTFVLGVKRAWVPILPRFDSSYFITYSKKRV